MLNFFHKFLLFFKRPGQYFRYKNKTLRGLYFQFSKFFHLKTFYSRVYKKNFPESNNDNFDLISREQGYKLIKLNELIKINSNIKTVLQKINFELKNTNFQEFSNSDDGIISLKSSKDFNCESPELEFVTNKCLIEIVSRYLKCVPLITNLSLWYSPNDKVFKNSSQEYHLDHEDFRQVKGFLFINDIDHETGPLNIINAQQSNNIQKLINYKLTKSQKRVSDKTIKILKNKNSDIKEDVMIGSSGDLLLCDTSSCFHFGSRLGSKPRFILAFQYITPFGFSVDWNWKNYAKLPFKNLNCGADPLTRKVIGNDI